MSQGWGSWLLEQLGRTQVWELVWSGSAWAVLGGAAGFLTGVVACLLLSRAGAFRWDWKHARWFRGLALAALVLLWTCCGAAIGMMHGALRGAEVVLRRSQLATEAFPVLANAGADLLAYLAVCAPLAAQGQAPGAAEDARLEAFRRGEWELDAVTLLEDADQLSAEVARQQADQLEASVLTQFPSWKGGRLQRGLRGCLDLVAGALVDRALDEELDRLGEPGRLARHVVEGLPAAAAAAGDPRTLSRAELSEHLIQEGIVPALLIPLRQLARGQQLTAAVVLLLGTLLPIAAFRLAEHLRARGSAAGDASSAAGNASTGPGDPAPSAGDASPERPAATDGASLEPGDPPPSA